MRTTADRMLHATLTRFAGGDPLARAVDFGVARELDARLAFAGRGPRAVEWLTWAGYWAQLRNTPQRERILEGCFRWTITSDAGRSCRFTQRVAGYLAHGAARVDAVCGAIDDERQQRLLDNWCDLARTLYSPDAVFPYLRPYLYVSERWVHPIEKVATLAKWVASRVRYKSDARQWLRPDVWQPPALTLSLGTGDCEDSALVVWSALPLLGLEIGRLVVGTVPQGGHAWVELPQTGVFIEATNGNVLSISERSTRGYAPYAYFTPTRCSLATDTALSYA